MSPPPDPPAPPPTAEHDALPPGTRFGEFEILRVVGIGGFGIVYRARDHSLERDVALKEYMPASLAVRGAGPQITVRSAQFAETYAIGLRSFVNEARLLARFDHPSLVKVYRFWEDNQTAYMVMPFLQGVTLRDTRRAMSHPPDEAWIRRVLDPIMGALELLHREGVYHRDIAPDNILLPPEGPPVLLDFGAARRVISDRTQSLTAILKPSYAPIEQYADMSQLRQGPWTDIYALGAVVHYLLFGQPPAPATARALQEEPDSIADRSVPGISPRFLEAVAWALAVRPNQRPQQIDDLRGAFDGRVAIPAIARSPITLPGQLATPPVPAPGAPEQTFQPTLRVESFSQRTATQPRAPEHPTVPATANLAPPAAMPPVAPASAHAATGWPPAPATSAPWAASHASPTTGPGPGAPTTWPPAPAAATTWPPTAVSPPTVATGAHSTPPMGTVAAPMAGGTWPPPPAAPAPEPAFDPRSAAAAAMRSTLQRPAPPPRAPQRSGRGAAFGVVAGVVVVAGAVAAWFALGSRKGDAPVIDSARPAASAPASVARDAAPSVQPITTAPAPTSTATTAETAPPVNGTAAPATSATTPALAATPPVVAPPVVAPTGPNPATAQQGTAPSSTTSTTVASPSSTSPARGPLNDRAATERTASTAPSGASSPTRTSTDAARVAATTPYGASAASTPTRTRAPGVNRADGALRPLPGNERADTATPTPSTATAEVRRSPPAAAPATETAAGPTSAREACGGRVFIALAVCMERECDTARFRETAECKPILERKRARESR